MALTLLEASKINDGNVKRQGIIEMFAMNSDILRVLPFQEVPGDSYSYTVEGKLPAVAFRGYNENYGQVAARGEGVLNPQTEHLKIAGGTIDVDRQMIRARGSEIRAVQEMGKVKAMALQVAGKIINGDSDNDIREFDGLRKRVVGSQIFTSALGATDAALSLHALDTAIDAVDAATHLIMSKAMKTRLSQAMRNTAIGGFIRFDKDEFGQSVMFYNDLPILVADYDDTGARVIDFNEVGPSAGASTNTSIYVVSIGPDKFTGLQNGSMEVEDLGDLKTDPVFRTRVEWMMGMAVLHGRAVSRVWGITNTAITV